MTNHLKLTIPAIAKNVGFARSVVSAFAVDSKPTLEEINDIKTAVSEAVTNCVVHAYKNRDQGDVEIVCNLYPEKIEIQITDFGVGIANLETAMQPLYTSSPESERSGMGFTVMETFMSSLSVKSNPEKGVTIFMTKIFGEEKC